MKPLDQTAQILTKAIAMQEGGGRYLDYNHASGDTGTSTDKYAGGRYQFLPDTWHAYAGEVLGDKNAPMTPENQNRVAYTKVKSLLDQGMKPAQVASVWNAGDPEAYKNYNQKHGNTPLYTKNVQKYAQQLSSGYTPPNVEAAGAPVQSTSTGYAPPAPYQPIQVPGLTDREIPESVGDKLASGDFRGALIGAGKGAASTLSNVGTSIAPGLVDKLSTMIAPLGVAAAPGFFAGSPNASIKERADITNNLPKSNPIDAALAGTEIAGMTMAPELKGVGLGGRLLTNAVIGGGGAAADKALQGGSAEDIARAGSIGALVSAPAGFLGNARSVAKTAEEDAIKNALSPAVTAGAIKKAGPRGLLNPAEGAKGITITNPYAEQQMSSIEKAAGKNINKVIDTAVGSEVKNYNTLDKVASDYAEKMVRPFEQARALPTDLIQLQRALDIPTPENLSGRALEGWNQVKNDAMEILARKAQGGVSGATSITKLRKMGPNGVVEGKAPVLSEWDLRKAIDEAFDRASKGKIFGDDALTGSNEARKQLREAFKDYLTESYRYPNQREQLNNLNEFLRTPEGQRSTQGGTDISLLEKQFGLTPSPESEGAAREWETHMNTLHDIYNAQDAILSKVNGMKNKTGNKLWELNNPKKAALIHGAKGVAGKAIELGLAGTGLDFLWGGPISKTLKGE